MQRKKYETRLTNNVEDDRDEPKLKKCKLKKIQLGNRVRQGNLLRGKSLEDREFQSSQ